MVGTQESHCIKHPRDFPRIGFDVTQKLNGNETKHALAYPRGDFFGHGEVSEELPALAINALYPAQCELGLGIVARVRAFVTQLQRDMPAEIQRIEGLDDAVEVGGIERDAVPLALGKDLLAFEFNRRYGLLDASGLGDLSDFFDGSGGGGG